MTQPLPPPLQKRWLRTGCLITALAAWTLLPLRPFLFGRRGLPRPGGFVRRLPRRGQQGPRVAHAPPPRPGLARALLRALAPPPPPRASLPPWGCCNVPQTAVLVQSTSAMCVQSLDDSLSPAIHTTYRISLRSSSLREPRYPLLRVVSCFSLSSAARPARASQRRAALPASSRFSLSRLVCRVVWYSNAKGPRPRPVPPALAGLPLRVSPRSPRHGLWFARVGMDTLVSMILPQVHLRKPCYDFSFL